MALQAITPVIDRYAIILHSQRYSDLAISFTLEVEEEEVQQFYEALATLLSLKPFVPSRPGKKPDCRVLLSITFTQGSGSLKSEIPSVPG